jgi:hypothetical protein
LLCLGGCAPGYRVSPLVEKPPMATPADKGSVFDTDSQSNVFGLKLKRSW